MKHSWYLVVLAGFLLIAQFVVNHSNKPVSSSVSHNPVIVTAAYGPEKTWEWQLVKADYEDRIAKEAEEKRKAEEEARLAAERAEQERIARETEAKKAAQEAAAKKAEEARLAVITAQTQQASTNTSSTNTSQQSGDRAYWQSRVATRCAEYGFDETTCAKVLRIAKCESGFNPYASNGGVYLGLFQQGAQWWAARAARYGVAGSSAFDGEANITVSLGMMRDNGFGAWECQ